MQVLGTFITEWDPGREACARFLVDEKTAERAAAQLAGIADFYGFEGWLINIENDLDAHLIPTLVFFLRYTFTVF